MVGNMITWNYAANQQEPVLCLDHENLDHSNTILVQVVHQDHLF